MGGTFLQAVVGSVIGFVVVVFLGQYLNIAPSICSSGVIGACIDLDELPKQPVPDTGAGTDTDDEGEWQPPPPLPPANIAGTRWEGSIDLFQRPNVQEYMAVRIYFGRDGYYSISNPMADFDPGRWERHGRTVSWVSSSHTYYTGRIEGNVITGRSENPAGTFYLRRVS